MNSNENSDSGLIQIVKTALIILVVVIIAPIVVNIILSIVAAIINFFYGLNPLYEMTWTDENGKTHRKYVRKSDVDKYGVEGLAKE